MPKVGSGSWHDVQKNNSSSNMIGFGRRGGGEVSYARQGVIYNGIKMDPCKKQRSKEVGQGNRVKQMQYSVFYLRWATDGGRGACYVFSSIVSYCILR